MLDQVRKAKGPVIPIGFSLGALVTLLAVARWAETEESPQEKIPAAVIVAPPHGATSMLMEGFRHRPKGRRDAIYGIPAVVLQIGQEGSPLRKRADQAFRPIVEAGIELTVVHWAHERVCPYTPPSTANILGALYRDRPVMRGVTHKTNAAREHMAVRDDRETTLEILRASYAASR
ncbi:MAG: hypothetical protein WEB00_06215 [Dehalococcoidia bacterium]